MEPDTRTFLGKGCLINASGCLCATKKMLAQLEPSAAAGICTKTATMYVRGGNPEPRYWEDRETGITLNSMGLPNLGIDYYLNYFAGLETDKWRCLSLLPEAIETQLAKIQGARIDAVEWNMSCPNLVGKQILAYDIDSMATLLARIGNGAASHPIKHGIKLPPYYEPEVIADVVVKCILPNPWISFIHVVNSVPNALVIDPETDTTVIHPKEGHGGLGGPWIKPIALANVHRFYLEMKKHCGHPIDIIGCGGVSTGQDVYEFILAGASAVSIGSQLMMEGPECFARIEAELKNRMEAKGVLSLDQIRGRLNIRGPD